MRKLVLLLLLTSTAIANQPGDCAPLLDKCDAVIQAQQNEIAGLKDALAKSRSQTEKCFEDNKTDNTALYVIGGVVAGIIVGAAIAK